MIILIISIYKKFSTNLVIYVRLNVFGEKSLSMKVASQQLTFEKGHMQNIKASNVVRDQ